MGFSLVEALVAMLFTALLMAGMFAVFSSSTSSFMASTETLSVQRKARWGLTSLQDDILHAGHLVFKRTLNNVNPEVETLAPFVIRASGVDRSVAAIPANAAVDELEFVMDVPLGVEGTLDAKPAEGATTLAVKVPYGAANIKSGDIIFLQDSAWEMFQVASGFIAPTDVYFNINILGTESSLLDQFGNEKHGSLHASVQKPHLSGAPFTVFRPLQRVKYSIEGIKLDPNEPGKPVPCLVRTVGGEQQLLMENVTNLRVNISLDGGASWIRPQVANDKPKDGEGNLLALENGGYSEIWTRIKDYISKHPSPWVKQAMNDPMWMNYLPVVIRIDLTVRSEMTRSEFGDGSEVARRGRVQTLFLSPRNYGLGKS